MADWYGVWVLTGEEERLRVCVAKTDGVQETLLPMAQLWERKDGEWAKHQRVLIPSYIFIHCRITSPLYYAIKNTPGVIGWLGKDTYWPATIPQEQMAPLIALMDGADPAACLQDVTSNKRQRRGYGTLDIGGLTHKIPFNVGSDTENNNTEDDKQAEEAGG